MTRWPECRALVMAEYLTKTYGLTAGGDGSLYVNGQVDGLAALSQAIDLMLQIEGECWAIFSAGYGVKLSDLWGKDRYYAAAEAERRIKEALLRDERVLAVEDFTFTANANSLLMEFVVKSVYGESRQSAEVAI